MKSKTILTVKLTKDDEYDLLNVWNSHCRLEIDGDTTKLPDLLDLIIRKIYNRKVELENAVATLTDKNK